MKTTQNLASSQFSFVRIKNHNKMYEGDSYYKYDDDADKVADGFPRKISADFGSKQGGTDVIPDNLDAAVFDNRDSMIYFFKGNWVSRISK